MSLPSIVYLLCIATSAACMVLLIRGYRQSKARLLLWSAACFVGLALNNLLLFVDVIVLPTEIDLQPLRHVTSLVAVSVLLYGFIWETD
jgi:hypothetical protein